MSPDKHNEVPAPAHRETEMPQAMPSTPMIIEPDHAYVQPQQDQTHIQPDHAYAQPVQPDHAYAQPVQPDHAYAQPVQPDHAYTQPVQSDHAYAQPDHAYPQPTQTPIHTQQLPRQKAVKSQYPTATPFHALQSSSAPVDCPACGQREMTQVVMESGNTTHAWAAILCFCCCLGCLPYLASSLKDVNHHCAKCGVLLATWHNSGKVEVVHGRQRRAQAKEKK